MSGGDDWQAGDLALCVNDAVIQCPCCGVTQTGEDAPTQGAVREISVIRRCDDDDEPEEVGLYDPCPAPILHFVDGSAGHHTRFRKIRPHTPDAEDAETIALLNGKRVKVGELC